MTRPTISISPSPDRPTPTLRQTISTTKATTIQTERSLPVCILQQMSKMAIFNPLQSDLSELLRLLRKMELSADDHDCYLQLFGL